MPAGPRIALALGLSLAIGCAGHGAPPTRAIPAAADPAAVFAAAREREAQVHTLRAQFDVRVTRGGEVRQASGVLLVKKPERFRLRLLSPIGLTVFDYTTDGAHRRMVLPTEGKSFADAAIDTNAPFSPHALRAVFLRGASAFPSGCDATRDAGKVMVRCAAAPEQPLFLIDPETADLGFEGRGPIDVTYLDYRAVGGTRLPYSVVVSDRDSKSSLAITIHKYDVNPELTDALFDPQEPPP